MESPELFISIGELIGIPKVALRGCMAGWHDQAITGVLAGFEEDGAVSMVLDLTAMTFADVSSAASFIKVLRSVGPSMCVHVIVTGDVRGILERAKLGPCIKLYSSNDEIAECLSPSEDFFTSRWIQSSVSDKELPLAA
jgi:anti-anti-sigma regulatory factor